MRRGKLSSENYMPPATVKPNIAPEPVALTVDLKGLVDLDDDQLFEFCVRNRELRVERTPEGDLILMSPAGGKSANLNLKCATQLAIWAQQDGTGEAFDSSGGFLLPNGAMRSPDSAWVERSRLKELTPRQRQRFLPLSPTFVLELRSPSDALAALQTKMEEYRSNGVRLGWLLDPQEERVHVYHANDEVQVLDRPTEVGADPVLPGFALDLQGIWDPGW